jgi:hypothetical protein
MSKVKIVIFFTDGKNNINGEMDKEDAHNFATSITNGEGFNWGESEGKTIYYPAHMVQEVHVYD